MKPPRIESTTYTRLLHKVGEQRRFDEAVVRASFEGGVLPLESGDLESERAYAASMLRTSALFVIAAEDLMNPLALDPTLPPLPYRRVYLELWEPDPGASCVIHPKGLPDGWTEFCWMALAIEEVIQGEVWRIVGWLGVWDRARGGVVSHDNVPICTTLRLNDEGAEDPFWFDGWPDGLPHEALQTMVDVAVDFAHYMDAFGGYTQSINVPRGHAREHKRRYGYVHQAIHFISLRQINGQLPKNETGRHVTCRFPVRGHWVKWQNGRLAGTRSWRKAHIRGPEGAPFKGRPFYFPGDDD